jgi:TolA-binding protein
MIDLSKIPETEKTPLVTKLLHIIQQMAEQIDRLREEIARLKEHKGKPKIPQSRLEKDSNEKQKRKNSSGKRPGSAKRSKTKQLTIHETIPVPPKEIPPGSTRAGHDDWIVQGIKIELHNVCYRLER